ncbi:MAG: hypothetical protein V4555_21275 [Acidobacteriota bacterium]
MRTWIRIGLVATVMSGGCAGLGAQQVSVGLAPGVQTGSQPQVARPEGAVTGTVICSDTQMPARFATVMLMPVKQAEDAGDRGPGRFFGGGGGSGRTDLQGNFSVNNVAVGDYYVVASATGYVSAMDAMRMVSEQGGDASTVLAGLPQVHVAAGVSSNANLSLARGGVIAGKLVWDDGSPAAGVQVSAVVQTDGASPAQNNRSGMIFNVGGVGGGFGITDDRGQFRLTGLMAAAYLVRATVEAPASGPSMRGFSRAFALTMYAPGKIRKSDAKAVTVGAGEERDDAGFTLNLQGLHTVSGHVSAVSGPAVMAGTVRIVDATDSSLSRTAQLGEDGNFSLTYVPSGTYTLTASGSTSAQNGGTFVRGGGGRGGPGSAAGASFQEFTETLSVTDGDVTGVGIELTPAK